MDLEAGEMLGFIWFSSAFGLCFLLYAPISEKTKKRFQQPRDFARAVEVSVVLDLAAASLRSGAAIPRTLETLAQALQLDSRVEFSSGNTVHFPEIARHLLLGSSWEEAWADCSPRFMRLSSALAPAWNDGAAPVPLLVRSAQNLRLTRQHRAKEAAAKLSAKLVLPLATCFLPAFLLVGVLPVIIAAGAKFF